MFMLQLFDGADEVQPVDARLIRDGIMRIGRDSTADWPIADPDCELSRVHCDLEVVDDELVIRVLGANGVFDEATGQRLPDAVDVTVQLPSTLRLGRFRLCASRQLQADGPDAAERTLVLTPPLGSSTKVPGEWADGEPLLPVQGSSLLEAFCEGAGLDPSMFSIEEPQEIMRRAGALYRQMVLGIGDLMEERDRARGHYKLSRTTIGGRDNNPFKWAPNQRLAIDLLTKNADNFLSGPAALQASFRDIKRHLIATFAGLHGSLLAAIDTFEPGALDAAVADRVSLLKSRSSLQVEESAARYADLCRQLLSGEGGSLERAFVTAYDAAETQTRAGDPA